MGPLRAILDFFRRFLGLAREPVLSLGTGTSSAPVADDADDDDADESPGNDATRDGQVNIEDEWADLQVLIARCEAETIDLAGLDIRDPATFWARQLRIEEGQRGGKGHLHAVVSAGFRSLEHWHEVSHYYQAKWSQLSRRDNGELEIRPHETFTNAALRARDSAGGR